MSFFKHLLKGFSVQAFPDPGYTKTVDQKWLGAIRRSSELAEFDER
jgi:hypothetical protein